MAIVGLGSRNLNVGGGVQTYNAFSYKEDDAYIVFGQATIEIPTSVFSAFRIRALILPDGQTPFLHPEIIQMPIDLNRFAFWIPMSKSFSDEGVCAITVERVGILRGTGDRAGAVSLALSYEDKDTAKSWRE